MRRLSVACGTLVGMCGLVAACVALAVQPSEAARPDAARKRAMLWIPSPASGIAPAAVAVTVFRLLRLGEDPNDPGTVRGSFTAAELSLPWLAVEIALAAAVAVVLAYAFNDPDNVAPVWRVTRAKVWRSLQPALIVAAGLAATLLIVEQMGMRAGLTGMTISYGIIAALVAVAIDLATEWRARGSPQLAVLVEHRPYAAVWAVAVLARRGIPSWLRNGTMRVLLQVAGPYAPIEIMVAAEHADWAREALAAATQRSPGPEGKPRVAAGGLVPVLALGGVALIATLLGALKVGVAPAPPRLPQSRLEIVVVDDEADPFAALATGDGAPRSVRFEIENAPLGPGRTAPRYYLESLGLQVPDEVVRYARTAHLPAGERLGWGKTYERGDDDAYRPVGWRTYVLGGAPILDSRQLRDATAMADRGAYRETTWHVQVSLDAVGAKRFEEATRANVKRRIAIVVDGEVTSAPVVNEAIAGGAVRISMGSGSVDQQKADATRLADALQRSVPH